MAPPPHHPHSIADCLNDLGVSADAFDGCESLEEEFQVLKKIYFAKILQDHPDKGGDAATFRQTRTAFEVLRDLKASGRLTSLTTHLQDAAEAYDAVYEEFGGAGSTPSYEYYYEAAQEEVPGYKVELAKTGRSQCVACKKGTGYSLKKKKATEEKNKEKEEETEAAAASNEVTIAQEEEDVKPPPRKKTRAAATKALALASAARRPAAPAADAVNFIPKSAIRVGSLDEHSGSYGRWHHLSCWRVPYRVWAGLTDPSDRQKVLTELLQLDEVLLTNVSSLTPQEQSLFVEHVMDRSHWARKTKASKPPPNLKKPPPKAEPASSESAGAAGKSTGGEPEPAASSAASATSSSLTTAEATASTAIVGKGRTKEHFVIPRPGVNGAIPDCLANLRFVMTGLFPEVGGGTGLNLGKNKVTEMIESFGGVVTSAVSGKTNFLVVGKEPGLSKVTKARKRGVPQVDIVALQDRMLGRISSLEDAEPLPAIQSFSAGYRPDYHLE